jgi:Domain of unknown function (DUF3850)
MSTTHELKSWPEFFEPVASGVKSFELRKNDRNFQVGDELRLREYDPVKKHYTGRDIFATVIYVMHGVGTVGAIEPLKGLAGNYVILGIAVRSWAGAFA